MRNGFPLPSNRWRNLIAIGIVTIFLAPLCGPLLAYFILTTVCGYTSPLSNTPFPEAHQRAIHTFVASRGFGISRLARTKDDWNEMSVRFEGATHWPRQIHLLGLTPEHGDRYFESAIPTKAALTESNHRPLEPEEIEAVSQLRVSSPWVKLNVPPTPAEDTTGHIRVIAPIHAQKSCLECHQTHEGSLLGAFDYYLVKHIEMSEE